MNRKLKNQLILIFTMASLGLPANQCSAQTATWLGGSGSYHSSGNWSGGVVPNGIAFDVFIDGGNGTNSIVTGSFNTNTTVDTLTIDVGDMLQISNNSDFIVGSMIDNDGDLELTTLGNVTDLRVEADVDLIGSGNLILTNAVTRVLGGGHLNNSSNTIQGVGLLGVNNLQITNGAAGTITANVTGETLTIDANANGMANEGVLRAESGGDLVVLGTMLDNTNGAMEALNDSRIFLSNSSVTNGTWMTSGNGSIEIAANTIVNGTDTTNLGTINQNNNTDFEIDGTFTNSGELNVFTVGNATDVVIDNQTSLVGGGTISLFGSPCRILDSSGGDGELTNTDHLIQGEGQIGVNNLAFTNAQDGIVDANTAGARIVMDPRGSSPMVNRGVIQASLAGELLLQNGDFDNTDGLIQANASSTVRLSNVGIQAGNVRSIGDGVIEVAANTVVSLENPTLTGTIEIENNTDFELIGNIDNQANINLTTLGNSTDINIDAAVNLSGGGTITLGGVSDACRILDQSGGDGVLTNVDHLIQGRGQIGVNNLQVINQLNGIIEANSSVGSLTLDPRSSAPMINRGLIRSTGGASLVLASGEYDNLGSLIVAENNSSMTLNSGASVTNGTLRSDANSSIEIPANATVTLTDLTLQGTVNVANNTDFVWVGDIDNEADINLATLGNSTDIVIDNAVNLSGGGTLTLDGVSDACRILDQSGGDGVLTNVDHLIQGRGQIGVNNLLFINQVGGEIHANEPGGTITLDARSADPMINRGLIRASNGSALVIASGEIDNMGANIIAENGTTVTLNSGANVIGGTLESVGSATIEVPNNSISTVTDLTLEGTVNVGNNADIVLSGTITNNADVNLASVGNVTEVFLNSPVVVNGNGSINLLQPQCRIFGNSNGSMELIDGTFTGVGSVRVPIDFNGSTVSPGTSVGELTFTEDTRIVNDACLDIEMGSSTGIPGTDWDHLDVDAMIDFEDSTLPPGVTIKLTTLDDNGDPGALTDFDENLSYSFVIASASTISGFSPGNFTVDLSGFANSFSGEFSVTIGPHGGGQALIVKYGEFKLGDINGDGSINLLDVNPFIQALSGGPYIAEADINCDGSVNLLDVTPFINVISG